GWEETYGPRSHRPSVWEKGLLHLRALQNSAGHPQETPGDLWKEYEEWEKATEIVDLNPILDRIVHAVTCDVAVLRGELPQAIRRVLIPVSGRSPVTTALEIGEALVEKEKGKVVALHVIPDDLDSAEDDQGEERKQYVSTVRNGASEDGRRSFLDSDNSDIKFQTKGGIEERQLFSTNGLSEQKLKDNPNDNVAPIASAIVEDAASSPTGSEEKRRRALNVNPAQTRQFQSALERATVRSNVEKVVVRASSVLAGILDEASRYDVVLMNASRLMFLDTHFFNGIPAEVALSRRQPTILVRPYEPKHHRWLRDRWQSLAAVFPKLNTVERAEISIAMRQAAQPSVDFFVLIFLAATIATLGLLQNSGAVIIGAMLVAPLMSPIASMAMGLVEGNGQLIRVAAEATVKGVVLAVSVGVAVTLLSPATQVTEQILARTQPTLLDLAVALASGAAAGYALSRKQVAAALPGVSIAVALVPPLCVVGYGIATSQYRIAGGGLLLFATNLVAIVLAAAIFFLLMGFRPPTTKQTERFQQGLRLSLISLALIAIPLAILLHISLRQIQQREQLAAMQDRIRTILSESIPSKAAYLRSIDVVKEDDEYVVHTIFYDYTSLEQSQLNRVEGELTQALGVPIRLEATLLAAQRLGPEGKDTVPVPPSDAAPAPPGEAPATANEVTPETSAELTPTPAKVTPEPQLFFHPAQVLK
ncbi:DUF389 domain-containing protein, partial [Candidatus Parcubacteria bacterium]